MSAEHPDPDVDAGATRRSSVDAAATETDPADLLRAARYRRLLLLAVGIGIPVSAGAYFYLQLVAHLQRWVYGDLPAALRYTTTPVWWPFPWLVLAGALVGAAIHWLPGRGGHSPADGFHAGGGPPANRELPGIALAALAGLGLGAVIGPEAPLIALGAGLAAAVVRLRGTPSPQAEAVVGATGSFAAISALLGSPLLGAFLLMEASGLGGPMLALVLIPGLLAAGIGTVIFVGLDSLTGLGTVTLAIPDLPPFDRPTGAEFGWSLVIGLLAPLLVTGIRWLALSVRPRVEARPLVAVPVAGAVIAALAAAYSLITGKGVADVLFSGQDQITELLSGRAGYPVTVLLLLVAAKGLAYAVALSAFRGGPIFPAMFLGVAGGLLLSHLPGLSVVAAIAMGIGAMAAAMLRLPFTAVLLATVLLGTDGVAVTPLVIVAVVVAYVTTATLPDPGRAGRR